MAWKHTQQIRARLNREQGTIYKDWGGRLSVILAFPNTYYVGMSSLALHLMYRVFNQRSDVVCERTFWEKQTAPSDRLFSYESQRPVTDADVFAFTISFEMDYFNVVDMLRRAGMPLWSEERLQSKQYDGRPWPFLVAGGPAVTMNPEPLAPFFDAFVIGEGEEVVDTLVEVFHDHRLDRLGALETLARIPGIYVPLLHPNDPKDPTYHPIERLWVRDMGRIPPTTVIHTPDTEFANMHLVEIARGCGRGCRFCLAGYLYRPPREQTLDEILAQARQGLQVTDRIGLVSAAVSDYSQIDALAIALRQMGARISVSSMRTDPISVPLLQALRQSGARTLTIAPEAGSERLRHVISKTQQVNDLLTAVDLAEALRFPQLKLYFMVGHPTETDEDIDELIHLVLEIRQRFRRRLVVNATPFVPKPHTSFQWVAMAPADIIRNRQKRIERALVRHRITVRSDDPRRAEIQAVLSRGDRRLAPVLADLKRLTVRSFHKAMSAHDLAPSSYLAARDQDEYQPWHIVDSGLRLSYFRREWRLAQTGQTGRPCPPQAAGCLTCGVCDPAWAFRLSGGLPAGKQSSEQQPQPVVIPLVDTTA